MIQAITSLVPGANTFVVTVTNACGTQTQTQTVTYNNCLTPSLGLLQPAASGITVNQNQYLLQFTAENVMNASEVSLKVNGASVPFQLANGIISANVSLNAGINTVTVSVKNTCGSDTETLQISYKQCLVPSIVFNTPAQLSTTTQQNMVSIDLDAVNCTVSTQVTIMRDGVAIPFNFQNGKITLNPVLNPGLNTFIVTATNTCGNDIAKLNVTYDNCVAPKIVLSAPIPATTSNATLAITANLQQITNAGQAILLVNGTGVPFTFNAGTLTANVPLIDGVNTISISATNTCGTDLETNTITYNACKTPVIAISSPVNSGSTVASANLTFTASVAHITQSNQITLILNGNPVTNFQFSNGILQAPLTLVNGMNTVVISANSGCGIAQEATTISLSTCSSPSVTIQTMTGQTVSNNSFSIAATVQEIANAQGLSLMVNGQLTPISLVNGAASAMVTLQNGLNTLLLSATNACGTDTKSIQVTYVPCTAPTIAIQNTNNTVVNAATYAVNATVTGVTQGQITMTLNGNPVNNLTLNGTQFTANLTLAAGVNHVVLTAQNSCGFDRKDLSVTYQNCTAPQISVNSGNDTVAQGIYTFSANVSNMLTVQGISLSLNGQAISNFSFVNGLLTANVNLANGSNTFALAAANACGAVNATSQVYYDHCQQPVITVTSVLQTSDGQYLFEATLLHVTDIEGVFFTFNGQNVPFNFVNGQLSATVTLNPGSNTF
ncbi:MAG: hypothetical protein EB023_02500 [Flavobacteriia bacterium]|nr:hypothetical protein [Flavobacteriia bacterium]